MKKREFTKNDFKLMLLIATAFTILYFIDISIVAFQDAVEWSDTVSILSWLGYPTLKIIVILCWYMCIERYFFVEYQSVEKQENKRAWIPIAISIVIVVIMGWYIFRLWVNIVGYAGYHWDYINKVYECMVIQLLPILGWIGCWIYCIKKRHAIGGQQGIKVKKVILSIFIVIALIAITKRSILYANERGEAAWFEALRERIEASY